MLCKKYNNSIGASLFSSLNDFLGAPGWLSGLSICLWLMILGSWDQVPHQAPCGEPASPSAYVSASFYVSLMNK